MGNQLMLELLEQEALHDYLNHKRIGCAGPEFLFVLHATEAQLIPAMHG